MDITDQQDNLYEEAKADAIVIATRNGKNAASWVFDGNTAHETYVSFLRKYEEGDPDLEIIREPSLSGEFADEYDETDLSIDLCISRDSDMWDDLVNDYQSAVSTAFWDELVRVAHYHTD